MKTHMHATDAPKQVPEISNNAAGFRRYYILTILHKSMKYEQFNLDNKLGDVYCEYNSVTSWL